MNPYLFSLLILFNSACLWADSECSDVKKYIDSNGKHKIERDSSRQQIQYLEASLKQYADDCKTKSLIVKADKLWQKYRNAQCDAVYSSWGNGSIRMSAYEGCVNSMNLARSMELWQSFLTYVDSTAPVLPEPK